MSKPPCSSAELIGAFPSRWAMILLERAWAEEQGGLGMRESWFCLQMYLERTLAQSFTSHRTHGLPDTITTTASLYLCCNTTRQSQVHPQHFSALAPNDKQKQILQVPAMVIPHARVFLYLAGLCSSWCMWAPLPLSSETCRCGFQLYKPSQNRSADRPNTRLLTKACSNLETRTSISG